MTQTVTVSAGKQTSPLISADAGSLVTLTPTGTAYLEYTTASLADARNGTATWVTWPNGSVTAASSDTTYYPLVLRVQVTSGTATVQVDDPVSQAGKDSAIPWKSRASKSTTDVSAALSTANSSASAAANTAAIQAALTAGGLVQITTPGTYYINSTLVIYSNTDLLLGKGVELKCLGSTAFAMIRNTNYNSTPIAISNISAASYSHFLCLVTVTFNAAHGNVAGGYVEIKGDAQQIYNGIWPVFTVPTATTLTFLMSIAGGSTNMPPSTATTVATSAQTVATHGVFTTATNTFVQGQPVTITGTPPGGFSNNTVYYVIANGLTTTNVQLADSPTAATGKQVSSSSSCTLVPKLEGSVADGNIRIIGGKLNANFGAGGFAAANSWNDHAIVLRRVFEPVVDGVTFEDVRKYCVMSQSTKNPIFRNISGRTGSDGIHVYGPCWNPLVENVFGTFGDDAAVFQPVDDTLYTQYMLGSGFDLGGDFFGGTMRHIHPRHTHNTAACALYPNGNTNASGATNQIYYMRGAFLIDGASVEDPQNINGSSWTGNKVVGVGNGYVNVAGSIDSLTIRNAYGPMTFQNSTAAKVITIRKLQINAQAGDFTLGNQLTTSFDYVNIPMLTFSDGIFCPSTGANLVSLTSANAVIGTLTFQNMSFNQLTSGQTTAAFISTGGALSTMQVVGCRFGAGSRLMSESTFVATPTINVIGCEFNGGQTLIANTGTQNLNININGLNSISPTTGLFNFYSSAGATYTMNVAGLTFTGTLFANQTGTYNFSNPDASMPIDITKIARLAGALAKHNGGTAAGTIVTNNLCVCDATGAANSWKQLSNTTLVF